MMKQKAGLGKKVSSIFDGAPLPNIVRQSPQAPRKPVEPQSPVDYRPLQTAPPPKMAPGAMPQAPRTTPQIPQSRPSVSASSVRTATVRSPKNDSWQQSIAGIFFSGNSEVDARNRKALIMVGVLSVALIMVVMWTGVFSGPPQKAGVANSVTAAAVAAGNEVRIDWTPPQPYPAAMRDPMQIGSVSRAGDGSFASGVGGSLIIVKSIVYSADNPTAVINGQIVRVGKSINGVTITKINKDSVEFSESGKSWKQQVE